MNKNHGKQKLQCTRTNRSSFLSHETLPLPHKTIYSSFLSLKSLRKYNFNTTKHNSPEEAGVTLNEGVKLRAAHGEPLPQGHTTRLLQQDLLLFSIRSQNILLGSLLSLPPWQTCLPSGPHPRFFHFQTLSADVSISYRLSAEWL